MSRKSRERREKHKCSKAEDYFSNGVFEMARFGKNIVMRNNSTPEQHAAQMEYLCGEYPSKYKHIEDSLLALKEKVLRCDPYKLLMYLRSVAISTQINVLVKLIIPQKLMRFCELKNMFKALLFPLNRMKKWCFQMMKKKKYFHKSLPNSKMYIMSFSYFIIIGQHIFKKRQKYLMNASKKL